MNDEVGSTKPKRNRWYVPPGMKFFIPSECRKLFKPKDTTHPGCLHVNHTEEPESTEGDRIIVFINQPITGEEKLAFASILREQHPEWFGCACWRSGDLSVRISLKTNNHLNDARLDVGTYVDQALRTIFANRGRKKMK